MNHQKLSSLKRISAPNYLKLGDMTDMLAAHLSMLDSFLPHIWLETIKLAKIHPNSNLNELAEHLKALNPCNYPIEKMANIYNKRLKRVLSATLLGMNNKTKWEGRLHPQNGEYISININESPYISNALNWNEGLNKLMNHTFI